MGSYPSFAFLVFFLLIVIADLCSCGHSPVSCIKEERKALLKLKGSFKDPSSRLSNWKGNDCCQWKGIDCSNITGHVEKLDLSNPCYTSSQSNCPFSKYNLEAQNVHPSLLLFKYLIHVDLSGNNFHASSIPLFIHSMEQLQFLSLSDSHFSGRIPNNIGNLTKLLHLDLSYNVFLYADDDLNWVSQLSSLQYLDMSDVYLGKAHNLFQVLNMLPSLLEIDLMNCSLNKLLSHNQLVSTTNLSRLQLLNLAENGLETSVLNTFQNMTSITVIDLSYNNLKSVPFWLRNCIYLVELYLGSNALHGSIPPAIQNLTSLTSLDLSLNNLQSIPSWLGELKGLEYLLLPGNDVYHTEGSLASILGNCCRLRTLNFSGNKIQGEALGGQIQSGCIGYNLEELDLSNNKLDGHLPTWLGQLENLLDLELESNLFLGPVPFSLAKLSNLEQLNLADNRLNGTIPDCIGQLVNLNTLVLSSNYFHGVIPGSLEKLVSLEYMDLSKNSLHGTIPQNLGHLSKLNTLYLFGNNLHGNIPNSFGELLNLRNLDMSANHLEGKISVVRWPQQLSYLNLFDNHFTGSLPQNIAERLPNVSRFLIGENFINDSIPHSLCQMDSLYILDLSDNKLSGEIPDCWSATQVMNDINLSANKLSGIIPSSLGNLPNLEWLHLNNNSLHGEFPSLLRNLKQLLLLDLGKNQMSGIIPSWTGDIFSSMQILSLRENMFHGSIPSHLCQLSALRILDLSNNKLTGPIPNCIGNLTGMILRNMSNETNKVPSSIAQPPVESEDSQWHEQEVLQTLKGRELDYTTNLHLLANMDLSNNNLSGSIPHGITSLSALQGLNLSYNHLSGEIPNKIGNMKSLESFDLSHDQLAGTIPNSMSSLNFLSVLNLSYNNFSGHIPQGNQLSTLDDPFIYTGNPFLCGAQLPNQCLDDSQHGNEDEDGKEGRLEKLLFYFVIALGFATGFWGVIGSLLVKKSWRHAYFNYIEEAMCKIYVTVSTVMSKLKKRVQGNPVD